MGERVLITGGAGFIGFHLATALAADGADVTIADDLSRGRYDEHLAALLTRCRFVRWDLTQPAPDVVVTQRFDTVYHLVAKVGVALAVARPFDVARVNVLSTLNLLQTCERVRPTRVFLSSTSEIGDGAGRTGMSPFPVPERAPVVFDASLAPRSSYATSKLMSEVLVAHAATEQGFAAAIGRYHNVYGARMGRSHVIPQLLERLGEDPFRLFGLPQTRSFCHVSDAVAATRAVTGRVQAGAALIVNIGNDTEETSIEDLALRLFQLAGLAPVIAAHAPPPGSPDRRLPDLTVLRRITGYEPRRQLADGLVEMMGWYRPDLLHCERVP